MRTTKKPTPFGRAIRIRLAELDMQQNELAEKMGVSKPTITHVIYGQRHSPEMVERICSALRMPVKAKWKKEA